VVVLFQNSLVGLFRATKDHEISETLSFGLILVFPFFEDVLGKINLSGIDMYRAKYHFVYSIFRQNFAKSVKNCFIVIFF